MTTSVRKWVNELPWMMQGTLFSAMRGPDGIIHDDTIKIVRSLRYLILKPASDKTPFLRDIPNKDELLKSMTNFYHTMRGYPFHFITHLLHAVEIIGYKHLDEEIREIWYNFYLLICKNLHLNPETEEQLDNRLEDDLDITNQSNHHWWEL